VQPKPQARQSLSRARRSRANEGSERAGLQNDSGARPALDLPVRRVQRRWNVFHPGGPRIGTAERARRIAYPRWGRAIREIPVPRPEAQSLPERRSPRCEDYGTLPEGGHGSPRGSYLVGRVTRGEEPSRPQGARKVWSRMGSGRGRRVGTTSTRGSARAEQSVWWWCRSGF